MWLRAGACATRSGSEATGTGGAVPAPALPNSARRNRSRVALPQQLSKIHPIDGISATRKDVLELLRALCGSCASAPHVAAPPRSPGSPPPVQLHPAPPCAAVGQQLPATAPTPLPALALAQQPPAPSPVAQPSARTACYAVAVTAAPPCRRRAPSGRRRGCRPFIRVYGVASLRGPEAWREPRGACFTRKPN